MTIKVLWVEDEPGSLRYEQGVAKGEAKWQITQANTVSQALDLIRDNTFDLVVADMILPPDDSKRQRGSVDPDAGIQLLESIRDSGRTGGTPPSVPILVITAVVSIEQKAKIVEKLSTPRYYLNKPLNENEYRKIVKELTEALESSAHYPA
jgi:CheY-like chemotaxis protein